MRVNRDEQSPAPRQAQCPRFAPFAGANLGYVRTNPRDRNSYKMPWSQIVPANAKL